MRLHTALGGLLTLMAVASAAFAQTLPQTPGPKNAITDVPGIEVGHYTATNGTGGMTGTTAIIARGGATAGVTQRGGAPGTRETDLLKSEKAIGTAHAVALSGGSAYGLAAADGVMTCLESQGIGTPVAQRRDRADRALGDPLRSGPLRAVQLPARRLVRHATPAAPRTTARCRWATSAPARAHARAA